MTERGGMSASGLGDHGRDGSFRGPWQSPRLSVLVFRATANSSSTGNDSQTQGQIVGQSPPIPFSPPAPPPPTKGNFLCDGQTPAPGAGSNNPVPLTPLSKRGGSHQDLSFTSPEHTLNLCNSAAF